MRPTRQQLLPALGAVCLVAVIVFLVVFRSLFTPLDPSPGTTAQPSSPSSNSAAGTGSPRIDAAMAAASTNSTDAPANSSPPPLDDLRGRAEVYGTKASDLRRRYKINDPNPESFDSQVTIAPSARLLVKEEYEKVQRAAAEAPRRALITRDLEAQKIALTSALAAEDHRPSPDQAAEQKKSAEAIDVRLRAEVARLEIQLAEMEATQEALRHPDDALQEYVTTKEDYLMAKARYQAARLVPLPPEQTKDWRRPLSNSR